MSNDDKHPPFSYFAKYPNAGEIFRIKVPELSDFSEDSIIVLDTNALLSPYNASQLSLAEIKRVFEFLKNSNRLILPGHVAREFAENRASKIKEIYQQLIRQRSMNIPLTLNPILNDDDEYEQLKKNP